VADGARSKHRSRTLIRGISAGALGRALGLAAPFITMPWLVDYLGPRGFGFWITATSLTTMSAFLDFGLGNALLTRLASALGRDALTEAQAAISSAYVALGSVALAALTIGGVLALTGGPILSMIGMTPLPGEMAIIASTLFGFLLGIPASIIHRVYYAKQQVTTSSVWQVLGAGLSVLLTFVCIYLQVKPWVLTLAYAVAPVVSMIAASFWFYAHNPALRPRLMLASLPAIRDLLALGLRFLSLAVLTSFLLNLDSIVIAWNIGPEAVTNFAVPAKLGSVLMLVVTTLFLPLWAANGEAMARGDHEWVRKNTRRMSLYGGLLVAILGAGLVLCGDWLIWLWMGRGFDQQAEVLAAVSAFAAIMAFTSPYNMQLNAQGRVTLQIAAWTAFGMIAVPAKYLLVSETALWWAPLSSAMAYAVTILPVMVAAGSIRNSKGM
jgi:O-antigen/teichoic acid export membrane protein